MSRFIICDIETAPLADAGQFVEPVEPDSRLKDPAKIAESIREKTAERDEKLGLDPDLCQIVALGFHVVGGADPCCYLMADGFEERTQLEAFWLAYTAIPDTKLVTFYGRQFDLPVLLRRSMYLGIKAPKLNLDRYRSPHLDVWDKLTFDGALRTAHSLKFYRKRLGLPIDDAIDGSNVAALFKDGSKESWDLIERHCMADVETTHALANKLGLLTL